MSNLSGHGQLSGVMRTGSGGGGGSEVIINPTGSAIGTMEKISVDGDIYEVRNVPDATSATNGDILTKTTSGVGWYPPTKELPTHTSGDNDKVLTIKNDAPSWEDVPEELPTYTSADNDKVLGINNGSLAWLTQGGGGGYSSTIIFAQDVSSAGNITLTDSIDNYKFILIATNQQGIYSSFHLFPVDLFKSWCNAMSNGIMCFEYPSRYMVLDYVNNTTLRIAEITGTMLSAIYGIDL